MSEKKPKNPSVSRREKLAAELRANLKRRKAKTRSADQAKAENPAKPEQAK